MTRGQPFHVQLLSWIRRQSCDACRRNYATIHDVNQALEDILEADETGFPSIGKFKNFPRTHPLCHLRQGVEPGKKFAGLSESEKPESRQKNDSTEQRLLGG